MINIKNNEIEKLKKEIERDEKELAEKERYFNSSEYKNYTSLEHFLYVGEWNRLEDKCNKNKKCLEELEDAKIQTP
jgi:hypothetical protein